MSPVPKSCPDSPERLSIDQRKKRRQKRTAAFDIITDANEAAEREISAPLLKTFAAVIVREEAAGRDPKMPDQIITAHLVFIADPSRKPKLLFRHRPFGSDSVRNNPAAN